MAILGNGEEETRDRRDVPVRDDPGSMLRSEMSPFQLLHPSPTTMAKLKTPTDRSHKYQHPSLVVVRSLVFWVEAESVPSYLSTSIIHHMRINESVALSFVIDGIQLESITSRNLWNASGLAENLRVNSHSILLFQPGTDPSWKRSMEEERLGYISISFCS